MYAGEEMAGSSQKATIAKAMIAVAVLMPAAVIVAVALRSHMVITGLHVGGLTPWMMADAALLGIGLLLHRGEDL